MIEEEAPLQQKEPVVVYLDLWVYVGIENCTFELVCSIFGWLEFGGNEKKEDHYYWHSGILLLDFCLTKREHRVQINSSSSRWGVCVHIYIYIYMNDIWVKLRFHNKTIVVGIILKTITSTLQIILHFRIAAVGSNTKTQEITFWAKKCSIQKSS